MPKKNFQFYLITAIFLSSTSLWSCGARKSEANTPGQHAHDEYVDKVKPGESETGSRTPTAERASGPDQVAMPTGPGTSVPAVHSVPDEHPKKVVKKKSAHDKAKKNPDGTYGEGP